MKKLYLLVLLMGLWETNFGQEVKNSVKAETYYYNGLEKYKKSLSPNDNKLKKEAIKEFDKAIKEKADYFQAYLERGKIKKDLENYSDAMMDFNKALELNLNYYNAYMERGALKKDFFNDYVGAEADFNKAKELMPKNAQPYFFIGKIKFILEDYQEAFNYFDKCVAMDSFNQDYYIQRAEARAKIKDYKGAFVDFTKGIELDKKTMAYFNRGFLNYELTKYRDAIQDFTKAIEVQELYLNAFYPDPYYYRGFAFYYLGDLTNACNDWQKLQTMTRKKKMYYKNTRDIIKQKCTQTTGNETQ